MKSAAPTDLKKVLETMQEILSALRKPPKRLLSLPEAAAYLGLAPKTLRNSLGPRAPKPFSVRPVRIGSRVLFRKEDLDRFIDGLTEGGE